MRTQVRCGWRARCAATDELLLAGMLAVLVLIFIGGFFLFVGELADLLKLIGGAVA